MILRVLFITGTVWSTATRCGHTFFYSIMECIDSTVQASIEPLHDKTEQLSSTLSECKEEVTKHQIQAQEKIFHKPFFQKEDTSCKWKITVSDKEHKQKSILNYEEQKMDRIMKFLNQNPTVIGN